MLLTQPQRKAPNGKRAVLVLLTLSLTVVIHAGLVAMIVLTSLLKWDVPNRPKSSARPTPSRPVMLRGLSADQFAKNRGAQTRDERTADRPEKKKEEKTPEKMPDGQVVATPKGNDQVDPKAKYVSESNNVAKKETRAKEQTAFYRNATNQQRHGR